MSAAEGPVPPVCRARLLSLVNPALSTPAALPALRPGWHLRPAAAYQKNSMNRRARSLAGDPDSTTGSTRTVKNRDPFAPPAALASRSAVPRWRVTCRSRSPHPLSANPPPGHRAPVLNRLVIAMLPQSPWLATSRYTARPPVELL